MRVVGRLALSASAPAQLTELDAPTPPRTRDVDTHEDGSVVDELPDAAVASCVSGPERAVHAGSIRQLWSA